MPNRLYNPTPKEFKFRYQETVVAIPPLSFYVSSEAVAEHVKAHYATIEVTPATQEEYLAFRKAEEEREAKEVARIEAEKKAVVKEEKKVKSTSKKLGKSKK